MAAPPTRDGPRVNEEIRVPQVLRYYNDVLSERLDSDRAHLQPYDRTVDTKETRSSNGHLYAKYNKFTGEQTGPFPLANFPNQKRLTDCYHRHTGIKLEDPASSLLFQPDSPAYPESRYYQDAAIRAAFEKIVQSENAGEAPRVLLSLATGAGKTIIAANLLWRLHRQLYADRDCGFRSH